MRISSNYLQLINRILTEEPGKPSGGSQKTVSKPEDRKELSQLITGLKQEAERLDEEARPERAAKLKSLADKIEKGEYHVDSEKLAEAMLKFMGKI